MQSGVFVPQKYETFDGLFGVFSDSLPDGWGRLLVDRLLMKEKVNPNEVDSLNRLAIVSKTGMGALTYKPQTRNSIGGEHATMINGNGRNPGMDDLLAVADNVKFDKKKAKQIANEIREIVDASL